MTSKLCVWISGILLATLVVISGCGKDGDAVVVDFNNTIAVERPKSPIPELATFNVAVAAMISPPTPVGARQQRIATDRGNPHPTLGLRRTIHPVLL
jgi:hypothetical protein